MKDQVMNAKIESTRIGNDDHGSLDIYVFVDHECGHQGFGGWALYLPKGFTHHEMNSIAGHHLWRIMEIADVETWDKLPGEAIRVRIENGFIVAIGHIVKEDWYEPRIDFKESRKEFKHEVG